MTAVVQTGAYTDPRREGTGKAPFGANLDPDLNSSDIQTDMAALFAELNARTATAARSGAGAVPITAAIALLTSTSTDAWTLAAGAVGQRLTAVMIVDGGTSVITPAGGGGGYTTITFADAGDSVDLLFINSKWYVTGQSGLAGGPVVA
jgi:hypothetical protein